MLALSLITLSVQCFTKTVEQQFGKRALNVSLLLRFSYSPFRSEILFRVVNSSNLLTSVEFIDQLSHLVHRFKMKKTTTKGNAPGVKIRKLLVYIVTFTCCAHVDMYVWAFNNSAYCTCTVDTQQSRANTL